MRDVALTTVVALLLLMVFKHPVLGAYVWAWLSLMNPHKLTYGFAFNLPFAQATAVVTLLALLFTRKRQPLPINSMVVVQMLLLGWMTLTSFFAFAPAEEVLDRWLFVFKINVMLWVTWMLVCDPKQLRVLVWVVTLSVAFFGIKGGVWTVLTGGGGRVWGPPGGMLQDNNALAVGLVVLMPMLYYLRQTETQAWLRLGLAAAMVACAFSILGSQSRGALLGLLAMAFFLGLKSKYPIRTSLALLVLGAVVIGFMPDTWTSRMDTMQTYQDSSSAMSRIWTWHTLWNAAVDRPFVGAGFLADSPEIFARYAPVDEIYRPFLGRVFVAHSIYFQMLGEHGFVGLGLFVLLGLLTWRTAARVARQARDDETLGSWLPLLMRMVQVSLVGFGAGGAFLSLAYVDLPYMIMGFVVLSDALVKRRLRQGSAAATTSMADAAARVALDPGRSGPRA